MGALAIPLMIAGTAVSAIGSIRQGQAASAAADAEAKQLELNAAAARRDASTQEDLQRAKARDVIGTQLAAQAGSGAQLNGSAADLLKQSLFNAEWDSQVIRYEGESRARGMQNQATMSRFEGQQRKNQGYLSAAGSLMSGASKAYGMSQKPTS